VACVNSATLSFGFRAPCDSLLVAVSPQHYSSVLQQEQVQALGAARLVLPFHNSFPENIRAIVESQPRCGTHYVIGALMEKLQCRYATVLKPETLLPVFTGRSLCQGDIYFDIDGDLSHGHVVKSHFFQPAQHMSYAMSSKYLKLIGYPFDSYYLWARDILSASPGDGFVLRHNCPEWNQLRPLLFQNLSWFLQDTPGLVIRYEDFWNDMDKTSQAICSYLGMEPQLFPEFHKTPRTYFDDDYERIMDRTVFETILEVFEPALAKFYPEKRPTYAGSAM